MQAYFVKKPYISLIGLVLFMLVADYAAKSGLESECGYILLGLQTQMEAVARPPAPS